MYSGALPNSLLVNITHQKTGLTQCSSCPPLSRRQLSLSLDAGEPHAHAGESECKMVWLHSAADTTVAAHGRPPRRERSHAMLALLRPFAIQCNLRLMAEIPRPPPNRSLELTHSGRPGLATLGQGGNRRSAASPVLSPWAAQLLR